MERCGFNQWDSANGIWWDIIIKLEIEKTYEHDAD